MNKQTTNEKDLIDSYPNWELISTGGGCEAWAHPIEGDVYFLITADGGCDAPDNPKNPVMLGLFNDCYQLAFWEFPNLAGATNMVGGMTRISALNGTKGGES